MQAFGRFFYRGLIICWKIKQCIPGLAGPVYLDKWIVAQFLASHAALEKRRLLHKISTELTWLFWMCYFRFGLAGDFAQDHGHVWSQHYCRHWAISLFIDNGRRHQFVPCDDEDWSDKAAAEATSSPSTTPPASAASSPSKPSASEASGGSR
ncbi:hypothetical protein SLS58_009006 [Diplodia intermedia]|uniref:Aminotransferase-like plant mobile domain-containing protein n=1 Tax=Diplodia intermedia TaxID=856260 RepID=A0ABR3TEX7_9PEZI